MRGVNPPSPLYADHSNHCLGLYRKPSAVTLTPPCLLCPGARGGGQVSLLNIITELKKCCNHPFLFESAEENYRGQEGDKRCVSGGEERGG